MFYFWDWDFPHLVNFIKLWCQLLSFERRLCRYIQRRVGLILRKYKRDKEEELPDGGTAGGRGRLADAVVDIFQNYYGAAIRNERRSKNKLKDAIWTINYHCILCENVRMSHCYSNIISAQMVEYFMVLISM